MKRYLSAILALCMIIALMPGVSVVKAADSVTYVLNYGSLAAGTALDAQYDDYAKTGNTWKWEGKSSSFNVKTYKFTRKIVDETIVSEDSFAIQISSAGVGDWVAVRIKAPASGKYNAGLIYGKHTNGGYGNVYLLPGSTTTKDNIPEKITGTPLNGETQVKYDRGNDYNKDHGGQSLDFGEFTIAENETEYVLVFKATEKGTADKYQMFPQSFTLTPIESGDSGEQPDGGDEPGGDNADDDIPTEEGYTFTYDLNPQKYGGNANTNQQSVSAAYSDTSATFGMWKWGEQSSSFNVKTYHYSKGWTGSAVETISPYTYGIVISSASAGDWVAVKLATPVPGTYDAVLTYGKHASSSSKNGGLGDVYLLPGSVNIAAALESATALNNEKINYCNEDSTSAYGNNVYALENKATVAEEESWLVFRVSAAGAGGKCQMFPQSITLTKGDGTKTKATAIYAELFDEVTVDGSAQLNVYKYLSNATGEKLSPADVTFEPSEGVAVDANGNVTGVTEGVATVKCSATLEGKMCECEVSFTVGPKKASEIIDSDVYSYDFNEGFADGVNVTSVTEYGTVNDRGLWKYHTKSAGSIKTHKWGFEINPGKEDAWAAIKIKVPNVEKQYYVSLEHGQSTTNGGYGDIYILPGDTSDIAAAIKSTSPLIADIAFYNKKENVAVIHAPASSALKLSGEHIVVFVSREKGKEDGGFRLYPGILTVDSTNVFRFVDLNLDKTEYKINSDGTRNTGGCSVTARLLDGTEIPQNEIEIIYGSDDVDVATFADGIVTAQGHGETEVFVTVKHKGTSVTQKKKIIVEDISGIKSKTVSSENLVFVGEEVKLSSVIRFNSGGEFRIPEVSYEIIHGEAQILDGGILKSEKAGEVTVVGKFVFGGENMETEPLILTLREPTTKTESTYYTAERVAAARENIKKYAWAKEEYETAKSEADTYLATYEKLYELIPSEGLPRSNRVGAEGDPDYSTCRYCGVDLIVKYGSRGSSAYDTDVVNRPWKVQCPDCKRLFPSNDFDKFYELGLDREGKFDRLRALRAHRAMLIERGLMTDNGEEEPTDSYDVGYHGEDWYQYYGYGVEGGYLYNRTYEELWKDSSKGSYNKDPRTGDEVVGIRWGVDDGLGYLPGRVCAKDSNDADIYERHAYIAYYVHDLWKSISSNIIRFAEMYAYTDDIRYGKAGAVILDRVADFYPTFSYKQWDNMYLVSHGGSGYGKIFGRINDCTYATNWSRSADAFWEAYNTPEVISFLSEKAAKYGYANTKTSRDKIWANIENGLLFEIFESAKRGEIYGNYGQQQQALASAAIVLAREPESKAIMDWIYQPGAWSQNNSTKTAKCTGGNLSVQLVDVVDRDGIGNEAAPNYNTSWIEYMIGFADTLKMYSDEEKYNLYLNPKFGKMFTAHIPLVLVDTHTAQIGDSGQTASINFMDSDEMLVKGLQNLKETSLGATLAEYIYRRNGGTTEGLHYDIWTKNPEQIRSDIESLLGSEEKLQGKMLSGYGFAVLREGGTYGDKNAPTYTNNMRDFWMYFGRNGGHGHLDTLNLGIEAFGLNFAPDMGYPQVASTEPHRYQWMESTISHNTVTVNEKVQSDSGLGGTPLHFDETDEVKIMDVDAPQVYLDTSIYRRTVVMINAGDDVSYGIDFFRVKGGNDHIYSFHSQSDEISNTEGLENIVKQTDSEGNYIGTYAGTTYVDPKTGETRPLEYGADPCGSYDPDLYYVQRGFTWLKNIRRAEEVGDFTVDFKVTDFRKVLKDGRGLHLKMTMLNDFKLSEVALASGSIPEKAENVPLPETFEYVLARHTGENLDSLFTTVYEPYRNTPYISATYAIAKENIVSDKATSGDNVVRAVKVLRADGRVDYIVYATDNSILYTITDGDVSFNFRGFVGVYSVVTGENGYECVYSYVHDGDVIGNKTYTGSYNVKVSDFTRKLEFNSSITVKGENIDASRLAGKYIFVENDGVQNGAYEIEYAEKTEDGAILHLADSVSPIRSYKDENDTSKGFKYNISIGQNAVIPLSNVEDGSPTFDEISSSLSASAGSSISVQVSAHSPTQETEIVGYVGSTLPRGASLDTATGKFTWKPDSSQVGENHVAITAVDEHGRETTMHFTIIVYGSTTSKPSDTTQTPSTENSDTSGEKTSSGGGGGGGGAAPTPDKIDDTANTDKAENDTSGESGEDGKNEGNTDNTGTENNSLRFTDLAEHSWAQDAINALAANGIIKGTTASTFSPAANITRADFAILLVRAFELTSDSAETFADVVATDYFAPELAVARNTGIVNGIGDNKYAPRDTITRQDMMVIVYRAMQKLNVGFGIYDKPQYYDFDTVAEYAKEAVSALIGEGLVNGKSGKIAPTDCTTRAEVAVMLKRMLDYVK